jgi:hypothetical protein
LPPSIPASSSEHFHGVQKERNNSTTKAWIATRKKSRNVWIREGSGHNAVNLTGKTCLSYLFSDTTSPENSNCFKFNSESDIIKK